MNIRVICIDNKNPANPDRIKLHHMIYEGEVYNVMLQGRNSPPVPLLILGIED